MDLYDDIDAKPKTSQIAGWSSSIKMLQTQLAIKKAQLPKEAPKKPLMTPVVNLKSKKLQTTEGTSKTKANDGKSVITTEPLVSSFETLHADYWDFVDEYDPQWPNEYEKLKDKLQSAKDKDRGRRDERCSDRKRLRIRSNHNSPPIKFSGFGQRVNEEDRYSPPVSGSMSNKGGVTIAPPPSLQEISIANDNGDSSSNVTIPYSASSVAAKIMAKYGFKDGQGLGKQEQGMSMALQVEKTSKRGGRIIHERDVFISPPPVVPLTTTSTAQGSMMSSAFIATASTESTHQLTTTMPPPPPVTSLTSAVRSPSTQVTESPQPSITEIMKDPSKVVLLRNMVGPGDVDEDLEPEVKDECNTKYGDVNNVIIHEAFGTAPEDAVKIFVEFKRIESAIKAVVDLNGRFFGGRQVRAGFYNYDKFRNYQLS